MWLEAILRAYGERDKAGLVSNPFPKPKFKLIDELNCCNLVQIWDKLSLEKEEDHIKRVKRQKTIQEENKERALNKFSMKLLGMSVFKTDKVDDMFFNLQTERYVCNDTHFLDKKKIEE